MNDNINITVDAPTITDAQLISYHISQYLIGTGFIDVTVSQPDPLQFAEPITQSEALQAIRNLNPALFDLPVNIDPSVFSWGGPNVPDGPDNDTF